MKYSLNLTTSLSHTKTLMQVGVSHLLEWPEVCENFNIWFNSKSSNDKDTQGFSIGEYKHLTSNEWRIKLYELFLRYEEECFKYGDDDKKYKKSLFKYNKVIDENTRLKTLYDLFPGPISIQEQGFHRTNKDIINKQAIIIDVDNKNDTILSIGGILPQLFKYNYIAYSSFNNTFEKPKFRVIIPTDRSFNISENFKIKELLCNVLFSDNLTELEQECVDITCFEPARFFYVPNNKPNNASKWIDINKGGFLCVDDCLKLRSKLIYEGTYKNWKYIKKLCKVKNK